MVMTHGGVRGSRSGSGLGTGTKLIDEGKHEFISLEIMRGVLDSNLVMFGLIMEGIIELMEEHFRTFRAKLAPRQYGARTSPSRITRDVGARVFWCEGRHCS